jgi:hypothetical protein
MLAQDFGGLLVTSFLVILEGGALAKKKPFIRYSHKVLNYFWPSLEQAQLGPEIIKP